MESNVDIVNIVIIGVLLSNKLEVNTKLTIIREEYRFPVSDELIEDVNIMCNLGQAIEDEAIAKGIAPF